MVENGWNKGKKNPEAQSASGCYKVVRATNPQAQK
jgi:hypothetical protein